MPEGDTIHRSAASLRTWLGGREVSAAASPVANLAVQRVVGRTVSVVQAIGKHLVITFTLEGATPLVLRTHMRMTGSWHVYPAGARWRRPRHRARVVIECGDRVAVCFDAPIIELTAAAPGHAVPGTSHLGPDILAATFDIEQAIVRARSTPPDRAIGEVLLDQRVVAGIGNIYRCESLFISRLSPWSAIGSLDDRDLQGVLTSAERLMRSNLGAVGRDFGDGPDRPWVYRRTGRPCRVCGAAIERRPQGDPERSVFWCPTCQRMEA